MGLDQLRLLRSQHKMARLLLVAALCLASVKAAVIPVEEIVDNLQSFLTAPEESGLRLKRSTGEWDKEFDLSSMGILFQLKYNNPWIGDYKLSRQGEFEEVSGSVYKIKWTGHGETTKGFLRRVSPVETNVVASVNVRNMKVDAIVWKSFAGKKY